MLLNEENYLEIINLRDIAKSKKSIEVKKGRVIGKHGSARMQIEEETGTKMAVYGRTISIIGNAEGIEQARRAVEMLLQGAKHTTTFRILGHRDVKFEL